MSVPSLAALLLLPMEGLQMPYLERETESMQGRDGDRENKTERKRQAEKESD